MVLVHQQLGVLVVLIVKGRMKTKKEAPTPKRRYRNHSGRISEDVRQPSVSEEHSHEWVAPRFQPVVRTADARTDSLHPPAFPQMQEHATSRFQSFDFPQSPMGSGQWVPRTQIHPPTDQGMTTSAAVGPSHLAIAMQTTSAPPLLKRDQTEPHRPHSYLPAQRAFTPLAASLPFVRTSPIPTGSGLSNHPGMPSMPSSDLLPRSVSSRDQATPQDDPFHFDEDGDDEDRHEALQQARASTPGGGMEYVYTSPAGRSEKHARSSAYKHAHRISADDYIVPQPSKSLYNPRYHNVYSHHQAYTSAANKQARTSTHMRNRSSGTNLTARTIDTDSSSATTRIRPVVFNDSPRSSVLSVLYTPASPYLASHPSPFADQHQQPAQDGEPSHPFSSAQDGLGRPESASFDTTASPDALTYNFSFPTPPRAGPNASAGGVVPGAQRSEGLRQVSQARRASGKLPDVLFSRAPPASGESDENVPPAQGESAWFTPGVARQHSLQHRKSLSAPLSPAVRDSAYSQMETLMPIPAHAGSARSVSPAATASSGTGSLQSSQYGHAL